MSRNTFILLGLLTGSVAMIGCSKNITAPSVSQEDSQGWRGDKIRQNAMDASAENLVKAVPEPKSGLFDGGVGNDDGLKIIGPKASGPGGPKGKLRRDLIDAEAGVGAEEAVVDGPKTNPLKNKWRQMQSDGQTGFEGSGAEIVAPAPDPRESNGF